ncbi:MAG: hypothetical protein CMA09_04525 [Euryarchaeota archaeon]|nr:hypothetical protein [Euryarchaeota archaeon]
MKAKWVMPVLLVLTFVLSTSSGCLGLLQAREAVESIREAPELDTDSRTYRDIKVFTNFFEWESYNNSIEIPVDSSVTDISIYRSVQITNFNTEIGCLENVTRYVRAEFYTPSGEIAWKIDVCEDLEANADKIPLEFGSTSYEEGNWRLDIEARGIGLPETPVQDNFQIDVTIKRTCLVYPLEDTCV